MKKVFCAICLLMTATSFATDVCSTILSPNGIRLKNETVCTAVADSFKEVDVDMSIDYENKLIASMADKKYDLKAISDTSNGIRTLTFVRP